MFFVFNVLHNTLVAIEADSLILLLLLLLLLLLFLLSFVIDSDYFLVANADDQCVVSVRFLPVCLFQVWLLEL